MHTDTGTETGMYTSFIAKCRSEVEAHGKNMVECMDPKHFRHQIHQHSSDVSSTHESRAAPQQQGLQTDHEIHSFQGDGKLPDVVGGKLIKKISMYDKGNHVIASDTYLASLDIKLLLSRFYLLHP